MFKTEDLQRFHQAVVDARNAVPFDQEAYDRALERYIRAVEIWAQEGMDAANEARRAISEDVKVRGLRK
jgi:tetrahydromethanopterin S-methyltransferase subunit A